MAKNSSEVSMKEMKYEIMRLGFEDVSSILAITDKEFTPLLSMEVNLQDYAIKLSRKAKWTICKSMYNILGSAAFYENKQESQIYISYICVLPKYHGLGIGKSLLDYTTQNITGFETMALEVNKSNKRAFQFYCKCGFTITDDRISKYLMTKKL